MLTCNHHNIIQCSHKALVHSTVSLLQLPGINLQTVVPGPLIPRPKVVGNIAEPSLLESNVCIGCSSSFEAVDYYFAFEDQTGLGSTHFPHLFGFPEVRQPVLWGPHEVMPVHVDGTGKSALPGSKVDAVSHRWRRSCLPFIRISNI